MLFWSRRPGNAENNLQSLSSLCSKKSSRLIFGIPDLSKFRFFKFFNRFWQASRLNDCRTTCKILKRHEGFSNHSHLCDNDVRKTTRNCIFAFAPWPFYNLTLQNHLCYMRSNLLTPFPPSCWLDSGRDVSCTGDRQYLTHRATISQIHKSRCWKNTTNPDLWLDLIFIIFNKILINANEYSKTWLPF